MLSINCGTVVLALVICVTYTYSEETYCDRDYDNFLSKIMLLETKFEELKNDVMEKETEQSTKIMVQEKMLRMQENKIASLQDTISEQDVKTSVQEIRIAELHAKNADQETTIADLRAVVDLSTSQCPKSKKIADCVLDRNNEIGSEWKNWTIEAIQRELDAGHTAFYVRMKGYSMVIPGIFVWDDVIINLGNGYDSATGIFTARESGVYIFLWTIFGFRMTTSYSELVVNGVTVIKNGAESGEKGFSTTASAILILNTGDEVLIRKNSSTLKIFGGMWSSFQGFKLK